MQRFGQRDTGRFFRHPDAEPSGLPSTDDGDAAPPPDRRPAPRARAAAPTATRPADTAAGPAGAPGAAHAAPPPPNGVTSILERSERFLKPSDAPDISALVAATHEALLGNVDLDRLNRTAADKAEESVRDALQELLDTGQVTIPPDVRDQVIEMVIDEVLGLGPIDPLLHDPNVQEVMVNAPDTVYVESDGVLHRANVRFRDDAHVRRVAERILAPIGRRIDEASPMVDARLPDGSRVNITIPPATPRFATITVRKFRRDRLSLEDLMAAGTLDDRMAEFLGACTSHRLNVLISGGTGTGKTTLLNAISAFIPRAERIVSIEDPLELAMQQPHVISMEARPADVNGRHAITQRDLLRNSLRMRPDRIIVGEVRGSEAFEMLQAMNTGHDGSLSTVHANSPRDALARIENMVLMAGFDLPIAAIREQIASALHLVFQMERGPDGVRRITHVTEVTGMEGNTVTMQDIFEWRMTGRGEDGRLVGDFRPTGLRPTFSDYLAVRGRELPADMFAGADWPAAAR